MVQSDNAVMALLVGAHLASASLALAHESSVLISKMYPTVPHIARFALRPERAQRELSESEEHLARIAIPYALSVHEDFINRLRNDLLAASVPLLTRGKKWNAENMHTIVFDSMGAALPDELPTFDLLRRIRNALIHSGGLVDQYLEDGIAAVQGDAEKRWFRIAGHPPKAIVDGELVTVGAGEIMVAFSVTRSLSKLAHEASLVAIPRTLWLAECVDDFLAHHREHVRSGRLLKSRLEQWADRFYEDFHFSWAELDGAARSAGAPGAQLRNRVSRSH
ncbi:hypothetical protein GCM10027406_13900 [Leifsonia lichenia]